MGTFDTASGAQLMAVRNCFVGGFQEKPLPWRGLFLEKKNLSFKRRRKLNTQTQMKY
jgi:hypothetical protein